MQRRDAPWLTVVGAVAVLHAMFLGVDTRLPGDRGLMFQDLSHCQAVFHDPSVLWTCGAKVTGWYNLLVSLQIHLFGASSDGLRMPGIVASVALVLGTAVVARRLAGPLAALVAACVVGMTPLAVDMGRILWFHVPEAALVVGALALLVHDVEVRRLHTALGVAVLGALALMLRNTGVAWVATLIPLLWLGRRGPGVWAILVSWSLAAVVPLLGMRAYLAGKVAARDRYVELVPDLAAQLGGSVGWLAVGVGVVGLALAARMRSPGPWWTLAAWGLGPLVLVAVFGAGIDNHTLFAPALGLAAGLGLSQVRAAWVVLPALFVVHHVWARVAPRDEAIYSMSTPYERYGEPELRALFDAACPSQGRRSCRILTSQGLFRPYSTSRGELELLAMGESRVRLMPARHMPHAAVDSVPIAALVEMTCTASDRGAAWAEVEPDGDLVVQRARSVHQLEVVWERDLGDGCAVRWSTPQGRLLGPTP